MVERKCEYPNCENIGEPENFTIHFLMDTPVNVAEKWQGDDYAGRGNWYCDEHFEKVKKEKGFENN